MEPQAYLHSHTYHATVDALESIASSYDAGSPTDLRTQIIQALGEIGGIWPMSCYAGEEAGPSILVTA
ncbi:hypothetical protein EN794_050495 [Mesorhizobium sp. M00.F.Ca.ET.151.01.1.1]|nr:hypothetical protein EN794_050495 [Mesorhizobium sp. M00.F.Ca.ET.151.01.1.1]